MNWSCPNEIHFGRKSWYGPDQFILVVTISFWSRPNHYGQFQINLVSPKPFWTNQNCFVTRHYNNETSKNKHFLILLSSLIRNSQKPKLKRIFEILWVLFEKIPVFYSDWPKSWIWRTLGHVKDIFCKCHLHNASKEVFWPKTFLNSMHGFKSAILAIFQFWQNDSFELVHEIQNFFGWKTSFKALWRLHLQKIFLSCTRVRQIKDLGQ